MLNGKKIALVTGGTSGIGLAAVNALHEAGVTVYETSRRDARLENAVHLPGDVTDEAAMARVVQEVLDREGRIDILVCCAGFGISGAVEYTELSAAKKQLDVNFFGVVNAVKAVLPQMRERGSGRIVIVSSVAGAIAIPFQTYYSVSKAALNAYVAALRSELRPYGVTATAVMPGDIATGFTDAREKSPLGDDVYGGRFSAARISACRVCVSCFICFYLAFFKLVCVRRSRGNISAKWPSEGASRPPPPSACPIRRW